MTPYRVRNLMSLTLMLVVLLAQGCSLFGGSALMRAAKRGDYDAAEKALLNGASVGEHDRKGNTPLHFAAQRDIRGALPALGDLDKPGAWETLKAGRMIAKGLDDALLINLLLSSGADPNAMNASGETPLHIAARNRSPHTALILLANGANPELKDKLGRTAAELAWQNGARELAAQLEKLEKLDGLPKATTGSEGAAVPATPLAPTTPAKPQTGGPDPVPVQ